MKNKLILFLTILFMLIIIGCFPSMYDYTFLNKISNIKYKLKSNNKTYLENSIYLSRRMKSDIVNDTTYHYKFMRFFSNGRAYKNTIHNRLPNINDYNNVDPKKIPDEWYKGEGCYYIYENDSVIAMENYLNGMLGYKISYLKIQNDSLILFKSKSRAIFASWEEYNFIYIRQKVNLDTTIQASG